MKLRQPFFNNLKSATGWGFFVVGFVLLAGRVDALFAQLATFTERFGADAIGFLPAFGLASLQVTHAFLYDRTGLLSVVMQFLVSCWPLVLLLTGAVLMYSASARSRKVAATAQRSVRGDR